MTRVALLSREPGQPGPLDLPHVAPQSPTSPWVVIAAGRGTPDMTHAPSQATLPLLIILPVCSEWVEDLLRMLREWGIGKDGRHPGFPSPE